MAFRGRAAQNPPILIQLSDYIGFAPEALPAAHSLPKRSLGSFDRILGRWLLGGAALQRCD
jgi:hypothetical protein